MKRGRIGAIVVAAALAAGLAACTPDIPEIEPDPEATVAEPVLDDPRLLRVLTDIEERIAEADENSDAELLEPRMDNPALRVREAEYRLQSATAGTDSETGIQPLTTDTQVSIVSATQDWPRTVLVVTHIPDGANTPLLVGLRQEAPRDAYKMFSWVRMLPEVTMPQTEIPEVGSVPVAPDSEDFMVSPNAALEQYADVLTNRGDSEFAGDFVEEPFRELAGEEVQSLADGVDEAGRFNHNTEVLDEEPPVAMQTADGGVIVVGSLQTTYAFTKTEADGELEVGGQLAALSESDGVVNESLRGTYDVMVSLYVPPPSDDAQITVIGVERVLASVSEE